MAVPFLALFPVPFWMHCEERREIKEKGSKASMIAAVHSLASPCRRVRLSSLVGVDGGCGFHCRRCAGHVVSAWLHYDVKADWLLYCWFNRWLGSIKNQIDWFHYDVKGSSADLIVALFNCWFCLRFSCYLLPLTDSTNNGHVRTFWTCQLYILDFQLHVSLLHTSQLYLFNHFLVCHRLPFVRILCRRFLCKTGTMSLLYSVLVSFVPSLHFELLTMDGWNAIFQVIFGCA